MKCLNQLAEPAEFSDEQNYSSQTPVTSPEDTFSAAGNWTIHDDCDEDRSEEKDSTTNSSDNNNLQREFAAENDQDDSNCGYVIDCALNRSTSIAEDESFMSPLSHDERSDEGAFAEKSTDPDVEALMYRNNCIIRTPPTTPSVPLGSTSLSPSNSQKKVSFAVPNNEDDLTASDRSGISSISSKRSRPRMIHISQLPSDPKELADLFLVENPCVFEGGRLPSFILKCPIT